MSRPAPSPHSSAAAFSTYIVCRGPCLAAWCWSTTKSLRFKSWPQLAEEVDHAVKADHAVLDGEICCLEADGRSNFNALLFRREWPWFYAFDVLSVTGEHLCALPLLERKQRLLAIVPAVECRLLYLDYVGERGRDLSRVAAGVT